MTRPAANDRMSKFQRYREARRQRGMRLVRIWVPDPRLPGFQEEAARQAALLRGAPDESDALDFIAAATDMDGDGP